MSRDGEHSRRSCGGGSRRSEARGARGALAGSPVVALAGGLLAALALGSAGCQGTTVPGGDGQAEAFVGDDPLTGGAATVSPRSGDGGGSVLSLGGGLATFTGTVAGDFQVLLSPGGQDLIPLGSLNGITVELQTPGAGTTVHGAQSVPAGSYVRVRLRIQDAEVTVAAGSTVGGIILDADAKLDLATDAPLVIERDVSFGVSSTVKGEVVFDLNAEAWITEAAVQAGAVSSAAVAQSVTARALQP